jgi:copper(I)-binding protein
MQRWGTAIAGLIAVLGMAGCATRQAQRGPAAMIGIDHMVIPAADAAGGPVAAYAGFDNRGGADRLLGIDCDCAASIELHRVVRNGDSVSMTNSFPLELPGNARTEVKPPGIPLHFMLIGTNRPFVVGQRVPMRLRFERAGVVETTFTVTADSAGGWANWTAP